MAIRASQVALRVKSPPTNAGHIRDSGLISGSGRSLQEAMATHSSIRAWKIPWTEKPGGLQSMESQSRTRLKRLSTYAWQHYTNTSPGNKLLEFSSSCPFKKGSVGIPICHSPYSFQLPSSTKAETQTPLTFQHLSCHFLSAEPSFSVLVSFSQKWES